MKVKTSYLLPALVALTSFVLSVQAQDELPTLEALDPNIHRELNLGEDKTLIYDHPSHLSVVKDSSQSLRPMPLSPAKISKAAEAQKSARRDREDEDVLSFNFLYYMLQKFKMSDLVDQE
jgi:hypothetical protein